MDKRFAQCILALIIALAGFQGCGRDGTGEAEAGACGLEEQFQIVSPGSTRNLRRLGVNRRGRRRNSLILVAPSVIRAPLDRAAGKKNLEFSAAPVFNVGDGIEMSVFLRRAGKRTRLMRRYFDPGRSAEDRDWVRISVSIEASPGDQIEIEAGAGPQGDLASDWLALSSFRCLE